MNNENELLRQASQFDVDSITFIFDEYYQPLYRYTYYHTRHVQTAEDLTAKVFQRLLEQLYAGSGPQQKLKAWLFRVAYNLIIDDSRRQKHRNHSPLPDNVPAYAIDIEADIERTQLLDQIYHALGRLTPKQRDIIILRYLMEMMPAEIADILETTVGSVKALQNRGIISLRRELQFEQEEIENE